MLLTLRRYNKSKKNARKKRLLAVVAVQQPIKNGLHAIVVACGAKMSAYFCVCTQVVLILHLIGCGKGPVFNRIHYWYERRRKRARKDGQDKEKYKERKSDV